ncbi:MAG: MFS transporter [Promethearchaeota archaeon]
MILSKRSVILILLSALFTNSSSMIMVSYVPPFFLNLGIKAAIIQLIITAFFSTMFIFPPLFGKISDRFQKRFIFILIGTIGIIFTLFLMTISNNLIFLIIVLFFYGIFGSTLSIISTLYAELVENDTKYISYLNAVNVGGFFVGGLFGGMFIDIYGIEKLFLFSFIISLIGAIFIVFIKENRSIILERYNLKTELNNKRILETNVEMENCIPKSIYYSLFFRNFGIKPILFTLAIIMSFHLNNNTLIGFLLGINFFFQIFQMVYIGRILTKKNYKLFILLGYSFSTIVIFIYIISIDFWGFLLCQILVSFSFSLHWITIITYIAQNSTPENKGKLISYASSSSFAGNVFGGLLFSLLLFIFNSDYYSAMYFMIIFPAISIIIILLKFEPKQRILMNSKNDLDS